MEKLITIQSELKAPKNQRNNFGNYNYRSTEDILEAVKPLLKENGCTLNISDEIIELGGILFVQATVSISDGQSIIESKAQAGIDLTTKGMSYAQCFGASSSYARKYALNGLFLIDDTKDSDATNKHGKEELTEKEINTIKGKITASVREDELKAIYDSDVRIKTNKSIMALLTERKEQIK